MTDCSLLCSCCPAKPHHAGDASNNRATVVIHTTSWSIGPARPSVIKMRWAHIDCLAWVHKRYMHFKAVSSLKAFLHSAQPPIVFFSSPIEATRYLRSFVTSLHNNANKPIPCNFH